ncbi:hypothetical protein BASA50_005881 [Batrachochytrium salamandrivorans]|uniref:Calcineurin-like phosphoesterase domain-containing protein n=1 Tax=Batrachochytrium salamandrivorans TaxID=1357716 RepID=A0ABQ8FBW9_9FUNG|nr:hypothetical protein BASA50_005881 [Batrachochytrium salamandrivorans]
MRFTVAALIVSLATVFSVTAQPAPGLNPGAQLENGESSSNTLYNGDRGEGSVLEPEVPAAESSPAESSPTQRAFSKEAKLKTWSDANVVHRQDIKRLLEMIPDISTTSDREDQLRKMELCREIVLALEKTYDRLDSYSKELKNSPTRLVHKDNPGYQLEMSIAQSKQSAMQAIIQARITIRENTKVMEMWKAKVPASDIQDNEETRQHTTDSRPEEAVKTEAKKLTFAKQEEARIKAAKLKAAKLEAVRREKQAKLDAARLKEDKLRETRLKEQTKLKADKLENQSKLDDVRREAAKLKRWLEEQIWLEEQVRLEEHAKLEAVMREAGRIKAGKSERAWLEKQAKLKEQARLKSVRQEKDKLKADGLKDQARLEEDRLRDAQIKKQAKLKAGKLEEQARLNAVKLEQAKSRKDRLEQGKPEKQARLRAVRREERTRREEQAKREADRLEEEKLKADRLEEQARREAVRLEKDAKLKEARLNAAKIEAARIRETILKEVRLNTARLEEAKIKAAKIEAARLEAAKVEAAKIKKAKAEVIKQRQSDLSKDQLEQMFGIYSTQSSDAISECRVVAIGDLHSDFKMSVETLQMANIIDVNLNWIAGNTIVVQTGDVVDRGDDTMKLCAFLRNLADQAKEHGGRLIQLLGNHEIMNMAGDLRYVSDEDTASYGGFYSRSHAFSEHGGLGRYLRSLGVAAKVDDTVFFHAGADLNWSSLGIDVLNTLAHQELVGRDAEYISNSAIFGATGPLWYRDFATRDDDAFCDFVKDVLFNLKASRMVIGHTPTEDGRISNRCNGLVYIIDVGISKAIRGSIAALEIVGDHVTPLYPQSTM